MMNEHNTNALPAEERNAIFRALRELKQTHQAAMNKDVLAELLIGAAITEGFDSGTRITGTLARLGMNRRHAGIILNRFTGILWAKGENGRYVLIEPDDVPPTQSRNDTDTGQ